MPAKCTRCGEPAQVSSPDARCLACFRSYLRKTLKTNIGRLGAGGRPTTIAIALSGGYCSTALSLLYSHYLTTLNPNPHAPPPRIVILHAFKEEPPAIVKKLAELLPDSTIVTKPIISDVAKALKDVKDATDVASIRHHVILQSLTEAAQENGCDKLLLGTSATRAAADVLHATITARGTLVRDAAAPRIKSGIVEVIRPLRDIPTRQLARYAMLELPDADFLDDNVESNSGLYDVVSRFIGEVGVDNPASVHNIVRTAGKLLEISGDPCDICGASVITKSCCGDSCDGDGCGNRETLCVGCQDCVKRDKNVAQVVKFVSTERRRRKAREEMRVAIQDFIL